MKSKKSLMKIKQVIKPLSGSIKSVLTIKDQTQTVTKSAVPKKRERIKKNHPRLKIRKKNLAKSSLTVYAILRVNSCSSVIHPRKARDQQLKPHPLCPTFQRARRSWLGNSLKQRILKRMVHLRVLLRHILRVGKKSLRKRL